MRATRQTVNMPRPMHSGPCCVGVAVTVAVAKWWERRGGGEERGECGVLGCWGGGGGGCGADRAITCNELKADWCQCTGPFGWTDQPEKPQRLFPPKAGSRRPQCKPHPTPRRGKRLRGKPTSLPTPTEEGGGAIFSISRS